jgi:hypothetical protein
MAITSQGIYSGLLGAAKNAYNGVSSAVSGLNKNPSQPEGLAQAQKNVQKVGGSTVTPAPLIGIKAKNPVNNVVAPSATLPANQVNNTPKPAVQATTEGGTNSTTNPNGLSGAQISQGYSTIPGQYNPVNGQLNGSTPAPTTPAPSTSPAPNGGSVPYTANNGLYGQLITGLANQGNSQNNQTAQTSEKSLQDVSSQNLGTSGPAYNEYQSAQNALKDLQNSIATQTGSIESQPISMQFQQGKEQALARQNASLIDAAQQRAAAAASALGYGISGQQAQQSGYNSAGSLALTGQSTAQSGLQSAATLAAPKANTSYFGSPVTGGVVGDNQASSGTTGQFGQTLTGNSLIDGQVNTALTTALRGGSTTDAIAQISNNPVAMQQFTTAMQKFDPNWTPTSGNAIAQQNMNTLQKYQGQAADIQAGLSALDSAAANVIPNMGTTGFNPYASPIGNQTFQEYFANKNPAAYQGILEGLNDVKGKMSTILSSSTGMTPTGVTSALDKIDFTTLNPQQLSDFIQYVNGYAQSNLAAAQQAVKGATSGYGAYEGANATSGALPTPQSVSPATALAGTGASIAEGLVKTILNNAGSAVAGAAGGAIEQKLAGTAAAVLQ